MAKKGTSKAYSIIQEENIARIYSGKRSASSGAADTDAGDVRSANYLIECKMTMKKLPTVLKPMEKVTEEAWQEGRIPLLTLRFFDPDSILADQDGWIDLEVRRVADATTE